MGANAQTSVPVFTSGQVLTAQQQTEINTGIPVFATSVERDAAFGGTGEKTLAEGQFAFLEDTDTTQYYDGSVWESVGVAPGLVLISTTTIGTTVSSVTVTGAFSSAYDNYKIKVSGGTSSTNNTLRLVLGATTTGYYAGYHRITYSGPTLVTSSDINSVAFTSIGYANLNGLNANIDLQSPNLAKNTFCSSQGAQNATTGQSVVFNGFLNNTTQYTAFTLSISSGTLTGGTIKLYGYANS